MASPRIGRTHVLTLRATNMESNIIHGGSLFISMSFIPEYPAILQTLLPC